VLDVSIEEGRENKHRPNIMVRVDGKLVFKYTNENKVLR